MAKILVSVDNRLLERLDREAAARGVSRSALVTELAAKGLGEPLGPGADPKVHEALDRLKELFHGVDDPIDFTQVIRETRDLGAPGHTRLGGLWRPASRAGTSPAPYGPSLSPAGEAPGP